MIPVDADFSRYDIIAAPVLYMIRDGMKEALEDFVKNGGTLITTFMSGIVGQSDNVYLGGYPGPLREMAGIWVEGDRRPCPGAENSAVFDDNTSFSCGTASVTSSISNGRKLTGFLWGRLLCRYAVCYEK